MKEAALVAIAKERGIENARPITWDRNGLAVFDRDTLIQAILNTSKQEEPFEQEKPSEQEESSDKTGVLFKKIHLLYLILAIVVAIATLFVMFRPDNDEDGGLTPTGGHVGGSAIIIDNEFGYITYGN